jgi:hypothetical protein
MGNACHGHMGPLHMGLALIGHIWLGFSLGPMFGDGLARFQVFMHLC